MRTKKALGSMAPVPRVTGDFFTTKDINGHEKISLEVRCIPAGKATSMKFFRTTPRLLVFCERFFWRENSKSLAYKHFSVWLWCLYKALCLAGSSPQAEAWG